MTERPGIDPRGPRFGAGITAFLLLIVVALALGGSGPTPLARALEPQFLLFSAISAVFAWAAFAGISRHPYGKLFRIVVRPRLRPPAGLEDPVPPTFAQGVGFVITLVGLVLELAGVPFAIVIAASAAFIAAFLNCVFGYCLGCQIYLLLVRSRVISRKDSLPASLRA